MTYPASRQPRTRETLWLVLGFGALVGLFFASFLLGQSGVTLYLGLLIIAAIVVVVIMPRDLSLGLARTIALLIAVILVLLMIITGLPLIIAEILSPIAQSNQDEGGNLGATVNAAWVGTVTVIFFFLIGLSIRFVASRSIPMIMLSAFLLSVALFPFLGMVMQEAARQG